MNKEYEGFEKYIIEIVNPERARKGFNELDKDEILECWKIIDKFNKTFMNTKTTDA